MQDIAGAVAFLKEHPRGNGKLGFVGFCMGGALPRSPASASVLTGLAAVVPFYAPRIPGPKVDTSKVTAPIQAHYCQAATSGPSPRSPIGDRRTSSPRRAKPDGPVRLRRRPRLRHERAPPRERTTRRAPSRRSSAPLAFLHEHLA